MKETSAKISYLEQSTLESFSLEAVMSDNSLLPWSKRWRYFLLRHLCSVTEGVVGVFRIKQSILSEKKLLEWLEVRGYVTSFGEGAVFADYPRLNFFGAEYKVVPEGKGLRAWGYSLPCQGAALAIKKTIWEMIERHASYYDSTIERGIRYPVFKVGDASHLFSYIPKFTAAQLASNNQLVSEAEDLAQAIGYTVKSLTGGPARFLPADCFYWGKRLNPQQKKFYDITTSGSGAGMSKEQAVLSAFYELIERDTFMLLWLSGLKPKIIDVTEAVGPVFDQIREAKERYKLEVYFFDTTYDIAVPTTICLIIDPILNLVAHGGKASASGEKTIEGAYLEALAILSLLRSRGVRVTEETLKELITAKSWGNPFVDMNARMNLYNSPLGVATLRSLWLDNNQNRISFAEFAGTGALYPDFASELNALIAQQKQLMTSKGEGYQAYVHYFSSDLLDQFDYHVAHVFVPAFIKLQLNESLVTPVSDRVVAYAAAHGKVIKSEADLNPLPHPFP